MMSQFSTTVTIVDSMKKYSDLEKRFEKMSKRLDIIMRTLDDNDIKMQHPIINASELIDARSKLKPRMDKFEREFELKESKTLFRMIISANTLSQMDSSR
jgi:hypothetical protein